MSPHTDTEQLSAYLDGEVPGSERAGLEQHLASCAECSAKKSALEGVIRSVRALPPVTATESERLALRRAVLERAGAGDRARIRNRASVWRAFAATAAVAAALAGIVTFAIVKVQGPKVTSASSSPVQGASSAPPTLSSDADVRSYAASLGGVSSFLGQIHPTPADTLHQPAAAPAATPLPLGLGLEPGGTATTPPVAAGVPGGSRQDAQPSPAAPPTLASCTRLAVPTGAALLEATPVQYQGAPAWVIAYGASSVTAGTLDRAVVEVRSQAACALLDQATLIP